MAVIRVSGGRETVGGAVEIPVVTAKGIVEGLDGDSVGATKGDVVETIEGEIEDDIDGIIELDKVGIRVFWKVPKYVVFEYPPL